MLYIFQKSSYQITIDTNTPENGGGVIVKINSSIAKEDFVINLPNTSCKTQDLQQVMIILLAISNAASVDHYSYDIKGTSDILTLNNLTYYLIDKCESFKEYSFNGRNYLVLLRTPSRTSMAYYDRARSTGVAQSMCREVFANRHDVYGRELPLLVGSSCKT